MSGVPGEPPGELLAWDSAHFGCRIGRVRGRRLTPDAVDRIGDWAAREGIECLYFLADAADGATAPLAEANGFRLVDVRLTLERRGRPASLPADPAHTSLAPPGEAGRAAAAALHGGTLGARGWDGEVRPAVAADVAALRRLAAASHHDSRFYQDPHFAPSRAGDLYAQWIEKCWADPVGVVLVAAAGEARPADPAGSADAADPAGSADPAAPANTVQGYITAAVTPGGAGQISLFAVAAAARGQGTGSRLIAAALDWFAARGADPITVVTQGRNIRAQRIYQQSGLLSQRLELWFHRWHRHHGADKPGGAAAAWRAPRP